MCAQPQGFSTRGLASATDRLGLPHRGHLNMRPFVQLLLKLISNSAALTVLLFSDSHDSLLGAALCGLRLRL